MGVVIYFQEQKYISKMPVRSYSELKYIIYLAVCKRLLQTEFVVLWQNSIENKEHSRYRSDYVVKFI